jgi:monomeric isocitrate dehydrogenase
MGAVSRFKTEVASMDNGDFMEVKNQLPLPKLEVKIEFVTQDGKTTVLKNTIKVGEIIDSSVMHLQAAFVKQQ